VFPLHQVAHVVGPPHIGPKLFGREIIFEEFQPMWSRYLNVTDGRTGRQTDGRHTISIPCYAHSASRGKNVMMLLMMPLNDVRQLNKRIMHIWRICRIDCNFFSKRRLLALLFSKHKNFGCYCYVCHQKRWSGSQIVKQCPNKLTNEVQNIPEKYGVMERCLTVTLFNFHLALRH